LDKKRGKKNEIAQIETSSGAGPFFDISGTGGETQRGHARGPLQNVREEGLHHPFTEGSTRRRVRLSHTSRGGEKVSNGSGRPMLAGSPKN